MKKKSTKPTSPIEELTFNQVVDLLAGDALLKLVKGENWRSIIWFVCAAVAQWKEAQK